MSLPEDSGRVPKGDPKKGGAAQTANRNCSPCLPGTAATQNSPKRARNRIYSFNPQTTRSQGGLREEPWALLAIYWWGWGLNLVICCTCRAITVTRTIVRGQKPTAVLRLNGGWKLCGGMKPQGHTVLWQCQIWLEIKSQNVSPGASSHC